MTAMALFDLRRLSAKALSRLRAACQMTVTPGRGPLPNRPGAPFPDPAIPRAGYVGAGSSPNSVLPRQGKWLLPLAAALTSACATVPAPDASLPDYRLASNWGVLPASGDDAPVDVFYVHPTTFRSDTLYNQPARDAETEAWTMASVADRQLNAFDTCCRLFMPFYRQASSRAFVERDARGAEAYEDAYRDVRAAFRDFTDNRARDRPFILAGHSQGALIGLWLIQRDIAGTPLADRMIAAYLPGIGIPLGALPDGIAECESADQTGCVASWNGFVEGVAVGWWVDRAVADYGVEGGSQDVICTNPITFSANEPAASADASKGMLPMASKGQPPAPMIPHAVSARCEGGVLRVTPEPGISAPALPTGSLHLHDIAFFWADIAANASLRADAWTRAHD